MIYLKKFEGLFSSKKDLKKEWDDFEENKKKHKPVTITTAEGNEIIYNPFDREILNDNNVGKYVVLNEYPFNTNGSSGSSGIRDRNDLIQFIKTNVGKISRANLGGGQAHYEIKYENVPINLEEYFSYRYNSTNRYLISTEFAFISDKYDDCVIYITSNKYNL